MMEQTYRKVYVEVMARHSVTGAVKPIYIIFEDQQMYSIECVMEVRRAASTKVGGSGMRYKIRVCNKDTYLFEDEGRWFVEAKNYVSH